MDRGNTPKLFCKRWTTDLCVLILCSPWRGAFSMERDGRWLGKLPHSRSSMKPNSDSCEYLFSPSCWFFAWPSIFSVESSMYSKSALFSSETVIPFWKSPQKTEIFKSFYLIKFLKKNKKINEIECDLLFLQNRPGAVVLRTCGLIRDHGNKRCGK